MGMTPEHKAHFLIDKFGDMAEEVVLECKKQSENIGLIHYWEDVFKCLKIERERRIQMQEHKETAPAKDWEIVSYNHPNIVWYDTETEQPISQSIKSVKRLSDGEIFCVGEKITDTVISMTIKSFSIVGDGIIVNGDCGNIILTYAKKPKPIFKTHDGKSVFEGDEFWWVGKQWIIEKSRVSKQLSECDIAPHDCKTFSTKDAATEFVLMNKPCLSLAELLRCADCAEGDLTPTYISSGFRKRIIALARKKQNQ